MLSAPIRLATVLLDYPADLGANLRSGVGRARVWRRSVVHHGQLRATVLLLQLGMWESSSAPAMPWEGHPSCLAQLLCRAPAGLQTLPTALTPFEGKDSPIHSQLGSSFPISVGSGE